MLVVVITSPYMQALGIGGRQGNGTVASGCQATVRPRSAWCGIGHHPQAYEHSAPPDAVTGLCSD